MHSISRSAQGIIAQIFSHESLRHWRRNAAMSNKRRQFLGLAAGAIAVPATAGMVVAQGDPSRGREAPIPAQTSVPERRSAKSELTGLQALLNPEKCVVGLVDHPPVQVTNGYRHAPTC